MPFFSLRQNKKNFKNSAVERRWYPSNRPDKVRAYGKNAEYLTFLNKVHYKKHPTCQKKIFQYYQMHFSQKSPKMPKRAKNFGIF